MINDGIKANERCPALRIWGISKFIYSRALIKNKRDVMRKYGLGVK